MTSPGRSRLLWGAVVVVAAIVAGLQACQSSPPAGPRAEGRWTVDFRESFDGDELDPTRWTTCFWWATDGCTILSNEEDQWYVPQQVEVADGHLVLTAESRQSSQLGRDFTYASGMISSGRSGDDPDDEARYAFTFGSVEVRFRAPAGGGLWPAVWMLPVTNDSLPEIDLLEQYGDDTGQASMTLHTLEGGEQVRNRHDIDTPDLSEGWHTVGIDWTADHVTWFLDGKAQYRVEGDRVPTEPMYLLVNLAVGGPAGQPDPAAFPAGFLVDQITVWRQP